jgi:hypothetical protein
MKNKYDNHHRGHVYIEIYLTLALLIISLAVGFGQYHKYGLKGAVIGTLLTLVGIVLAFMILIWVFNALDVLNQKFKERKGYRSVRKSLHLLLLFCFFCFMGLIFCAPIIFRFDLSNRMQEIVLNITVPLMGILGTYARFRLKESFWPEFGRLCIFLALAFLGAILGMAVGAFFNFSLSAYLHAVDVGALIPLGIYIFLLFKKRH